MMTTSWMGSDFTLNDLVNQSRLTNDYLVATSFEGQRDGGAVFEYTLTPKPEAAVVWGKITLEVRQTDLMPIWQRYYDEDGKLVRELSFSDYKYVSGRLIPTRLVMRPVDQAGEQTTITYENIVFDEPISDDIFSLTESEAMSGRLLRLAWRNLWYNPGRTLIAMAAIGLGYAMLLFVACLMAGLRQQMIESGTDLALSDIEVHAPDYYPDRPLQQTLGGRRRD